VCVCVFTSVGIVDGGGVRVYISVKLSMLIRNLEAGRCFVASGAPLSTDTFM